MEDNIDFKTALYAACNEKQSWFDKVFLPQVLEDYRLLLSCSKNILDYLVSKNIVQNDPYKQDMKISDIRVPDDEEFPETEKEMVLGTRLSCYEQMLDFVCNYYKFSIANLGLENIKKFVGLNNTFFWTNLSPASSHVNTRILANAVIELKKSTNNITASIIADCLIRASKSLTSINASIKEIGEFQKELYKVNIRKNVLDSDKFLDSEIGDTKTILEKIRRLCQELLPNMPIYTDLLQEIVDEDYGKNKDTLRQELLKKLAIKDGGDSKKEKQVDTKAIIMDAVVILAGLSNTISNIVEKVKDNHDVLESEHNGFFDKLKRIFRRAFGIADPPCMYDIVIVDPKTSAHTNEKIDYVKFIAALNNRARQYALYSLRSTPSAKKLEASGEENIRNFVNEQAADCLKLFNRLNALDEYFKRVVAPYNRSRIKGLQMELTVFKNTMVKANRKRTEFNSYVEEKEQMEKLGIINEI